MKIYNFIQLLVYSALLMQTSCTDSGIEKIETRRDRIKAYKKNIDQVNVHLNWVKITDDLWKSKNDDIGIKTKEETEDGISISKYIIKFGNLEATLKSTLDINSFKYLGSSFYKDKNNVYTHYRTAGGGEFWLIDKADTASFKIIGDCYAKDKKHIFGERKMIMNVDYESFETRMNIGCFSKDKDGYYFWDEKIKKEDLTDSIYKDMLFQLK